MPASPELLFPFVPTEARHRFVYEMMSGKDIVLVRDGLSDLADFVTCLCAFAVEARKIRYRLNHPDLILDISRPESCVLSPRDSLRPHAHPCVGVSLGLRNGDRRDRRGFSDVGLGTPAPTRGPAPSRAREAGFSHARRRRRPWWCGVRW